MEDNFGHVPHPHQREHGFQPFRGPIQVPPSPTKICDPIENELKNILEEIKTITNKIRDEVNHFLLDKIEMAIYAFRPGTQIQGSFSLILPYFLHVFLPTVKTPQNSNRPLNLCRKC